MNKVNLSGPVIGVDSFSYGSGKTGYKVRLGVPRKVKEGEEWKTRPMPTQVTFFNDPPSTGMEVLCFGKVNSREHKGNLYSDIIIDDWVALTPKAEKPAGALDLDLDGIPF